MARKRPGEPAPVDDVRIRILAAAAELIRAGGARAATTHAVAASADVQAPTIYRLFEDKDVLLDAVAEREFANYVAAKKTGKRSRDPVTDLREGWDAHVAFGLANPALFRIMSVREGSSLAAVAAAGRLRTSRRDVSLRLRRHGVDAFDRRHESRSPLIRRNA